VEVPTGGDRGSGAAHSRKEPASARDPGRNDGDKPSDGTVDPVQFRSRQ